MADPRSTPGPTRRATVGRALEAYDALVVLGESIEDEWTYVTDLAAAGRARIRAAAGDLDAALPDTRAGAIAVAATEIESITDAHRAIDWLSTFPAVVELALGGLGPGMPESGA